MAINYTNLFTRLGKLLYAWEILNTHRGTTLPTAIKAATDQFASLALPYIEIAGALPDASTSHAAAGGALANALRSAAADLVIQTVADDNPQLNRSLGTALRELRRQMLADSQTVQENAVSISPTVTYDGANVGNSRLLIDGTRDGGTVDLQHMIPETLTATVTGAAGGRPAWFLSGEAATADRLDADWPQGSGASRSVPIIDPKQGDGLTGAANFETGNANNDYLPNGWLIATGTAGASGTIRRQKYGTSTVTIAGTPASGFYELTLAATAPVARTLRTAPIAWDAGAGDVQAALRALPGLELVTVDTTGTSPDYTHTINFVGAANVTITAALNALNTGSVTPANTVASGAVYRGGGALLIHGNGSELTRILLPLAGLEPNTCYGFCFWGKRLTTGTGALRIGLTTGALSDISYTAFLPSTWTTSFAPFEGYLYTGDPVADPIFLSVGLTTAMTNTHQIAIDNLALIKLDPLYAGGPTVAAVAGGVPHKDGDRATIPITNDLAGKWQTYADRFFDLRGLGLQLPSATSGAETILDSLIA